jgi:chorismate mutase
MTDDEYIAKVRREISDVDHALLELVNKRLRLVAGLKRYKDEHGMASSTLPARSGCCSTCTA